MFGRAELPNGVSLRAAQPGDAAFERMLYEARRWDLWLVDGEEDFVRELIAMQYRAQSLGYAEQYPDALYYIIEKTGTDCGRLVLDMTGGTVRVVDLAVIPEAQGKGIGTTVLEAIQNVAARIPAPVALAAHAMNVGAQQVYRRLGFRPAAEQPNPAFVAFTWMPGADAAG